MPENIKIIDDLVCNIGIVFIFITTVILLSYEINSDIDINFNHHNSRQKIKNIAIGCLGGLLLVLCNFLSANEIMPYYIGIDIFIALVAYVAGKISSANIALSISLVCSLISFTIGFNNNIAIFHILSIVIQMFILNTVKLLKARLSYKRRISVISITLTHFLLIYNINKNVSQCLWFALLNFVVGFIVVWVTDNLNRLVKLYYAYRKQAFTDGLTGLANVRAYNSVIKYICKNKEKHWAIIFIDIDDFKKVNRNYGHSTGDIIIREVGRNIKSSIPNEDFCFRVGGDEFLILHNQNNFISAEEISENIKNKILEKNFFSANDKRIVKITISAGVNKEDINSDNICELVQKADMAMYEAKRLGKNTIAVSGQKTGELANMSKNIDEI